MRGRAAIIPAFSMNRSVVVVRLCKTALLATVALFFVLVTFGNITDYGTNWQFVRHVLAMDTIFPDSTLTWRAITDQRLVAVRLLANHRLGSSHGDRRIRTLILIRPGGCSRLIPSRGSRSQKAAQNGPVRGTGRRPPSPAERPQCVQ